MHRLRKFIRINFRCRRSEPHTNTRTRNVNKKWKWYACVPNVRFPLLFISMRTNRMLHAEHQLHKDPIRWSTINNKSTQNGSQSKPAIFAPLFHLTRVEVKCFERNLPSSESFCLFYSIRYSGLRWKKNQSETQWKVRNDASSTFGLRSFLLFSEWYL